MEQKKITHAARLEPDNNIQVEAVKQLLYTLGSHSAVSNSLAGFRNRGLAPAGCDSSLRPFILH